MWNTIRGPPYMGGNLDKGLESMFSGGSHYQFGVETNIITAFCIHIYSLISRLGHFIIIRTLGNVCTLHL